MKWSRGVAAGILTLSACGIQPTGSIDAGPGARAEWESAIVYFLVDDQPYPATRPEADITGPQDLVETLAAGPTAQERETGLRTEVPSSVRLTAVDGRLIVDAPDALSRPALDQIACTLQRNGPAGPGTTLHAPDGTVLDDTGCPLP